jgi:hypothetical protein
VILTIRKTLDLDALWTLRGTLSAEEAEEMTRVIEEGRRTTIRYIGDSDDRGLNGFVAAQPN